MPSITLIKGYPEIADQKSATLQWVDCVPVSEISPQLKDQLVGEMPVGNRSCLLCLFLGDSNIPFMHVTNFGTAKWKRLKSQIGERFEIIIKGEATKNIEQLDLLKQQEKETHE